MIIYVSSSYFRGDEQTKDIRLNYLYMSQTFSILSLMTIFFTIINLMNNQFMSVKLGPNLEN